MTAVKKVLLISNYFHFKQEKASNRYRELACVLSEEKDIQVEVITSKFYQRTYEHRKNFDELTAGVPFKATFVDEMGYKKSICIKRLLSSRHFARSVMRYLKTQPKPDLIYQVVPTLDVAKAVGKYAKKNNIPFVIDVQDLWPEAFKMAINIPVLSDVAFFPLKCIANSIYKSADGVCAVSDTYVERVLSVNKKCQSGTGVYIGINLAVFDENAAKESSLKPQELKTDRVKLAYCGSLSKSYNIKLVIDALALLKNPPLFVVIGDGNDKAEFEAYAKEKKVDAIFTGFVEYADMCNLLCSCDIAVNPIVGTSVASIINKHGDYAASGKPVLNTQTSKEYCKLVEDYEMGFNCLSEKPEELAEKIKILAENEELREKMGQGARRCAEEKFDRAKTYKKLVNKIKGLL